jgi:hypothetical protein
MSYTRQPATEQAPSVAPARSRPGTARAPTTCVLPCRQTATFRSAAGGGGAGGTGGGAGAAGGGAAGGGGDGGGGGGAGGGGAGGLGGDGGGGGGGGGGAGGGGAGGGGAGASDRGVDGADRRGAALGGALSAGGGACDASGGSADRVSVALEYWAAASPDACAGRRITCADPARTVPRAARFRRASCRGAEGFAPGSATVGVGGRAAAFDAPSLPRSTAQTPRANTVARVAKPPAAIPSGTGT